MALPASLSRRRLLTGGAATLAAAGAGALTALPAAASLPNVNMEKVLIAAQIDPPKQGTGITPGAGDHVLRVERALADKGFLARAYIDGHFGSKTVQAYAAWQRSLGFSGIDANGLPGVTSLTALGDQRFRVVRKVRLGSRYDSYGGERTNTRTADMLRAADAMFWWSLRLTQGSYTSEDPTSAGTHDGGGVVDISVRGLTSRQRWRTVKALRTVGFAAWLRGPDHGFPYHIHAVAVADPDLSATAQPQVHDYYFGKNGLRDHEADNTPPSFRVPFTWWEKYLRS